MTEADSRDSRDARELEAEDEEKILATIGHPKGTLAIMVVYFVLFVLGWVGLYFGQFLPRSAPLP